MTSPLRSERSDDATALLVELGACPACGARVVADEDRVRCVSCGVVYGRSDGRLDLRLRAPKKVTLTVEVGEAVAVKPGLNFGALPRRHDGIDFSGRAVPRHLSPELLSHVQRPSTTNALALDLGCGDGSHRGVLEHAGYRYLGVDYGATGAPMLADAHALPLRDGVVDFALSIAVLEHIRHPLVMMAEAFRVLRPGASFIGTVAFLEPFHSDSYTHHSHLGTLNALQTAGFDVDHVSPSGAWQALRAQAKNALFPGLPKKVALGLVRPLDAVHTTLWKVAKLRHPELTEEHRLQKLAGAFAFVARKPG